VYAQVARVIDGDTIEVVIDGQQHTLRYIGIDTPETMHPTRGEEPFGKEATEANRRLVEGKQVRLVKDVSETDRYGRLLRYVFIEGDDGTEVFVNLELVRQGYARASTYPPDVAHQEEFRAAEREAQEAARGLWAPQAPTPTPAATLTAEPTPTGPAGQSSITVVEFHYNAAGDDNKNLNDEYFVLRNDGPTVNLRGWTATDEADHSYTFPDYELRTGETVTVHTGSGTDGQGHLYWGSDGAFWNNDGDTLTLQDASGATVLVYSY
jgi:micrococcal nuclease